MVTAIKHITAGNLHIRVLGQIPEQAVKPKRRAARAKPTPPGQVFYNNKLSWRECKLWLAANFGPRDYFVTCTYTDEFLPEDKKSAESGTWKKYIAKLRRVRKRRGKELKYIYVTEVLHGKRSGEFLEEDGELENVRLHHHFVVNNAGPEDLDELRSLWPGGGYVRIEPLDIRYYEELAKYMTKEAREFGRAKPGDRTWKRSMNLTEYQVEYIEIPMGGMALTPPPGAVDYEAFHEKNPYGFADCVGDQYFLFEDDDKPGYTYTGRRRTGHLNN